MFGISFSEILLILIISLLIFGPEQLPIIAGKLGKTVAMIRNFSSTLRQQFYQQSGLNQLDTIRQEMQLTLQQIKNQLHSDLPTNNQTPDMADEFIFDEYQFLYQPELDFAREPELFDE